MFNIVDENDIPGMIVPSECINIKKLAAKLTKGSKILEIGCWSGRSTWCWLDGAPEGAEIYTVDPFILDNKTGKHAKRQNKIYHSKKINDIMNYFIENGGEKTWNAVIAEHPRKDLHKNLFVGFSNEFNAQHDIKWDCVYLDGDHSYDGVNLDISLFEPKTDIICGDDYSPQPGIFRGIGYKAQLGVVKAVDEMCQRTGRYFWKDPDSSFWIASKQKEFLTDFF